MTIEYCDKCRRPLDKMNFSGRKTLRLIVGEIGCYSCEASASILLCKKCFDEMEIAEKVETANKPVKEPEAVDKFLDLFRELVSECVEEMR